MLLASDNNNDNNGDYNEENNRWYDILIKKNKH